MTPCSICGNRPATRTTALSLALVHNYEICDDDWCHDVADAALLAQADPSRRLGGAPL